MQSIRRPRMVGVLSTAALAAALAVIPIPYTRTVGHDVAITFATPPPPRAMKAVAQEAKRVLHAESVLVRVDGAGATLTAKVADRSREHVERVAAALARSLGEQKLAATATVTARTERATGSVYAMAMDRAIQIRVDTEGKTDAEIAAEIRAQLQAAGVDGADVQVQRSGDATSVAIGAELGDGRQLQIVRQTVGGPPSVEVDMGGLDDTRDPGMTDAQLQAKIEAQLRAKGLEGTVTVNGDDVRIQVRKEVRQEQ